MPCPSGLAPTLETQDTDPLARGRAPHLYAWRKGGREQCIWMEGTDVSPVFSKMHLLNLCVKC